MTKIVVFLLCLIPFSLSANEAAIRKAVGPKLGNAKIEGVQPAPVAGLWEVRIRGRSGMQVFYTDAAGTFLIDGNIYDLRSDRNLTEERLRVLNAIKFEALPLEQAVKVQRGDGRRVVAAWLDLALHHKPPAAAPNCENPVEKNVELGQSLGVSGTPTLIFANGERVGGGMGATDLIAMLDKAGKPAAKKR
jgi:hypothetical protein